jgi:hypothetical protein
MSTNAEKLAAVEREIGLRRKVFPRFIENKTMTQKFADEQISIFEEIASDYREKAEKERLL